jgi:formiminotetrahydrofolate cyclodeaminase
MATALLRKAFTISCGKIRSMSKSVVNAPLDELNRLDQILSRSADQDAGGLDYYVRALRLRRSNPAEKKAGRKPWGKRPPYPSSAVTDLA